MSDNLSLIPEKNRPPETPITSLGHELGIMFGFMAACVVIMVIYVIFWRAAEKREEAHQAHRRERLAAQHAHDFQARGGIGGGIGGVHEKMADAEGSGERRVELPGCTSLGDHHDGGISGSNNKTTAAGNPGAMVVGGTRFEFEFGFRGGNSPGPGAGPGSGPGAGGGGQGYGQRV
ncbi:hypothetical protein P168DRAFT_288991 [Aspergillus campestris IBT 28561]|uniref:Uncharacterized protein n=1 Tax=Aspergillus campestris (strain IBT 28561) TaxID=1392248 RepID=A0A2I1D6M8_ASPC2|nr:uncharacterized protein P168DRAFT_288991 [Aspergillus campestris IBT 28561]PKY05530.1 hypothetical protein P168DRAFT_288991 [Aspergillus campestris IBT 28561]